MKPITDKSKQWLWFIGLWCGGLTAMGLVVNAVRFLIP
jgi:hypothetical protein